MLGVDGFLPKPTSADEVEAGAGPLLARTRHDSVPTGPKLWRIRAAT
jgi:hypothetical protein